VTTATRSPVLPDIPTVNEFVPGYESSFWTGIGAIWDLLHACDVGCCKLGWDTRTSSTRCVTPNLHRIDLRTSGDNRRSLRHVEGPHLTVISTIAEAAQGCGRGWYYNGRRCVPQHDMGYRPHHRRYVEDDDIDYRRHHRRPGVSVDVAPGIRLHLGHHPRHHYDED